MSSTKFDTRQSANHAALSAIGSAANATLDTILSDINTIFADATYLPTASVLMERDANANTQANSFIPNFTMIVTSGGTTTLTVASSFTQQFTGTANQTVVLPAANTLAIGQQFYIANRSTGTLTVNANGGGLIQSMATDTQAIFTVTNISTSAGTWDVSYTSSNALSNPMTSGGQIIYGGPGGTPEALNNGTIGQVLTSQGGTASPMWSTLVMASQTFLSGTTIFTVPAGVTTLTVVGSGGGGGGGSGGAESSTGGSTASAGGAGGQGSIPSVIFLAVTPGDSIAVTIGTGGTGGTGVTGIENTSGQVNGQSGSNGTNSTAIGPTYGTVFAGGSGGGGGTGTLSGTSVAPPAAWTVFGNVSASGAGGIPVSFSVAANGSAGGTNQFIYPTASSGGTGQAGGQGGGRFSTGGGGGGGGSGFAVGANGSNGNVISGPGTAGSSAAANSGAGGGGSGAVAFAGGQGNAITGNGGNGGSGKVIFYWLSA